MIYLNLDLFYEVCNAIDQHYQKQNQNFKHYQNFYVINLRMHSMHFTRIFRRKKVNCYCLLNFPFNLDSMVIYYFTQIWFNPIKIFIN